MLSRFIIMNDSLAALMVFGIYDNPSTFRPRSAGWSHTAFSADRLRTVGYSLRSMARVASYSISISVGIGWCISFGRRSFRSA